MGLSNLMDRYHDEAVRLYTAHKGEEKMAVQAMDKGGWMELKLVPEEKGLALFPTIRVGKKPWTEKGFLYFGIDPVAKTVSARVLAPLPPV